MSFTRELTKTDFIYFTLMFFVSLIFFGYGWLEALGSATFMFFIRELFSCLEKVWKKHFRKSHIA